MKAEEKWITLDYLEFFCEIHQLMIGCHRDEAEVWISPLGPHPSDLTSEEVMNILEESRLFEIREMSEEGEEVLTGPRFLTRREMEQRIRQMMN